VSTAGIVLARLTLHKDSLRLFAPL
jgi:hypothetical protein